jgi:hypothetical protein
MKRPVGTVIDLLSTWILTTAGWGIVEFGNEDVKTIGGHLPKGIHR